jgi:hypothetical protein
MLWLDFTIEQAGPHFRVKGDTKTEVMDKGLYKPGDVFIVSEDGWLHKTDEVNTLLIKYEKNRLTRDK